MENPNKLPTADCLLVVRTKAMIPSKKFEDLYNALVDMKAQGVVLIPNWCDVLVCPRDIEIKMEQE